MLKKVLNCCIAATFGIYSASSLAQGSALNSIENSQQPIAPLMLASSDDAITDRYIVVLKQPQMLMNDAAGLQQFTQQTVGQMANSFSIRTDDVFDSSIIGFVANLDALQLKQLRRDSRVEYIEQDQILSIDPVVSNEAVQSNAIWGLDRIDQRSLPLD